MSVISSIVENINDVIRGKIMSDEAFQGSQLHGIVWPYPERVGDTLLKIVPVVITQNGSGQLIVSLNDTEPVMLYHRVLNSSCQYQQDRGGGDSYTQRQTFEMAMTVCGWRPSILISADDLSELLVNAIPNKIVLPMQAVKNILILPSGIDFDFIKVFRQEFDKVEYFLKPEQILLQIKYKVQVDVKVACI